MDEKVWQKKLTELRRELHKIPELGFKEFKTQKFVISYLKNIGLNPSPVAQTGVVALIEGQLPGPCVALRADMDALPINEETNQNYSSLHQGVMHACGHDGHMAILLATAAYLVKEKGKIKGSIKLIFQPSEEGYGGGAIPMIKEGVLLNPKVDRIYGLHIWNQLNIGEIGIKEESTMGATCEVTLKIKGKSGHAASPHEAIDSVVVASSVVMNLQTIISRMTSPLESGIITFGTINGGTVCNAIAKEVTLTGTIRSATTVGRDKIKRQLEEMTKAITSSFGASYELEMLDGYNALINDTETTKQVIATIKENFPELKIIPFQTLAAEDFSFFADQVPACYFFIGSKNEGANLVAPHHHPKFDFDEKALITGMNIFLNLVLKNG